MPTANVLWRLIYKGTLLFYDDTFLKQTWNSYNHAPTWMNSRNFAVTFRLRRRQIIVSLSPRRTGWPRNKQWKQCSRGYVRSTKSLARMGGYIAMKSSMNFGFHEAYFTTLTSNYGSTTIFILRQTQKPWWCDLQHKLARVATVE